MSIFEALVLGLVQGLTEFIPVSSSGHLLITHEIFGSSENTLAFDVALHVGTLLALLMYFRKDLNEC
jgi:undecaprenyl-diphosphatase